MLQYLNCTIKKIVYIEKILELKISKSKKVETKNIQIVKKLNYRHFMASIFNLFDSKL